MARFIGKISFITSMLFCILCFLIMDFFKNPSHLDANLQDRHKTIYPLVYELYPTWRRNNKLKTSLERNVTKNVTIVTMRSIRKLNEKIMLRRKNGFKLWPKQMTSKDLIFRLQSVRRNYQEMNKYKVHFQGKINKEHSPHDVLCQLKCRVNMTTINSSDLPASANSWSQYLPKKSLEGLVGKLGRCAVVTSAASMKLSGLGQEIDSHDAVLRFNSAPTKGFQNDVGSKTTFRLLNSQVVALPQYNILKDSMYKEGILIMWDPMPYQADIRQGYNSEYQFFEQYSKYRRDNPEQPFYILNPKSLWQLWDIIQENSPELIQPNPPSSGSLAILLMMNICDEVNVYEFLPSSRQTDLCYYYEKFYDQACTVGGYHPLMYEKNLVRKLNKGEETSISKYGKVTLPGIRNLHC